MNYLKEGKVQKDMTFMYYFDQFFIEMSRKDSVNKVETGKFIIDIEIGNLTKEINSVKNKYTETKFKLINKIETLDDVDSNIAVLIQSEFNNKAIPEDYDE